MATGIVRTFRPLAATQSTAVTGSSQRVTINYTAGARAVRMSNVGTEIIYMSFGDSTVTASTSTSMPLQPGNTEVFTVTNDMTHYAMIASTTGSTLYSTIGEGL